MNATCDLTVDWTTCANCARLKARVDDAEAAARTAGERVDQTYDEYRFERDAGRAVICTSQWRAWHDRIDNLEQALDAANATWTAAIDEWAASIHAHRRLHEARQQKIGADETAAADTTTGTAETEEMVTARKDAVDALVNIYGGHIDQWLEALRDRTHAQTDADDVRTPCTCAMCTTLDKDSEDTDTKPTPAERAAYFTARDHADDTDTPGTPGRRTAVRIVAYDAHKGGCHEVDPTDVPVWLLDTPNTAIARDVRQATLQEIRTLIDDLIDGPGERGEGES